MVWHFQKPCAKPEQKVAIWFVQNKFSSITTEATDVNVVPIG